ncbi:MAG: hypothetical protein JXA89_03085 [Anaerolineae bacterium]|nr:hypothetical protein [Anaerolineae bacterium]
MVSTHNLPAQVTSFVGCEALLAEIGERLADATCRLLTLVGPGGDGQGTAGRTEGYAAGRELNCV